MMEQEKFENLKKMVLEELDKLLDTRIDLIKGCRIWDDNDLRKEMLLDIKDYCTEQISIKSNIKPVDKYNEIVEKLVNRINQILDEEYKNKKIDSALSIVCRAADDMEVSLNGDIANSVIDILAFLSSKGVELREVWKQEFKGNKDIFIVEDENEK